MKPNRLLRCLIWADEKLPDWCAALFLFAGIVYLLNLFFPA